MKPFIRPILSFFKNEIFNCRWSSLDEMAFAEQVRDVVIGISAERKAYALWKAIFAPDNILVGFECYELNSFNEHYLDVKDLKQSLYVGVQNFVKYTKVTTQKTPYQYWMYRVGIKADPAKFVF